MLLASLNPAAVADGVDIGDAVRIDGAVLSRSDLVGAATSVAERVGGAQRVAVLAKPTATTVLAITGCLIAGVPVGPVPADVGAAERRHILTDSGAQLWLGEQPDEPEGLPHMPVRLHARSWHRYAEPPPEATALIMYTSGTTGPPKGVLMSRRAIAADIDALAEAWQWTPDDTLVHGLPLFHIHGLVLGLLGSLRIGNRFVHTGKPKPAEYAAAEGSLYFGVPTVWSRIVDDRDAARALSSARLLVSGSAALPVPVFDRLAELTGHPPVERYGASETLITLSTRADGERRPGWVGLPLQRCADPAGGRRRCARRRMTAKPLGALQVQSSDDVRRLPQPARGHRGGIRRRGLVPQRRRGRHRRRRNAPHRRPRIGGPDQDRRLPGRCRRDRDGAARASRRRRGGGGRCAR